MYTSPSTQTDSVTSNTNSSDTFTVTRDQLIRLIDMTRRPTTADQAAISSVTRNSRARTTRRVIMDRWTREVLGSNS